MKKVLPLLFLVTTSWLHAAEPSADLRHGPLQDLDGYFPFSPPTSLEAWDKRGAEVRQQVLVSQGLWPLPTKTPLNPVVHGRTEQEDYTVENVFFESMPGLFVTGNLYRPKAAAPQGMKRPGVLVAHGHWKDARFALASDAELKKELESGGERLANGGRSIFQSMGVQLARMGCVAFVYDMLGDSDSQQLSRELVHGFAKQRPHMNGAEGWGLFSPRAELHAQSVMGLQTWNSIRALDFLISLPEVDAKRLACTGASGGGTQTMMLAAIDPRLAVSCPAVMVSTAMQGGCTCENASLLRVGTGNIEFAALFAPKPQGMTTADDWTKELPSKGFPDLQKLYALTGAPDHVALWHMPHFPHNYNAPTREAIYGWLNRHFQLGLLEPIREREYPLLTKEQLTVWNPEHPAAGGGEDFERKLLRWWHEDAQRQITATPEAFRRIAAPAWKTIFGRTLDDAGEVQFIAEAEPAAREAGVTEQRGRLRNSTHEEEVRVLIFTPEKTSGRVVIWLTEQGTASANVEGKLRPGLKQLLDSGARVIFADLLFQQEEAQSSGSYKTRRVKNPREAAAYTFGYNHALLAQRVHDVLTVAKFASASGFSLIALDNTAPVAAAARLLSGDAAGATVIGTRGFRFANVGELHSPSFLPAAAKYGDLPGLLALGQGSLYLSGEMEPINQWTRSYSSDPEKITIASSDDEPLALSWLVKQSH